MQFTSVAFLIFYIIVLALIRIVPRTVRKYVLLVANIIFYLSSGPVGGAFLLGVAVLAYAAGIFFENRHPGPVPACLLGIVPIVLMFAYHMTGAFYPMGFSFYTLMAMGYIADVMTGKCKPIRRFTDLFICLSFFPVIVSGPIEKLQDISAQLDDPHESDFTYSFLLILWGLLEKISISNIAGLLVGEVFDHYDSHSWPAIMIATVIYAFQLYADFDGYSNIAFGCAGLLGINIRRNFRQPYLSEGVRDFWRRWHISLSEWLRDYVYIPLGGSRKGNVRKQLNVLITFAVSGLWHGAGLNFLVWGVLHGIYQICENLSKHHIKNRVVKIVLTFIAVDFAWFFFRAGSLSAAVGMLGRIGAGMSISPVSVLKEFAASGVNSIHLMYLMAAFAVLIITDVMRNKGIKMYETYSRLPVAVRWIACYIVIFWIILASLSIMSMDISGFIYGSF